LADTFAMSESQQKRDKTMKGINMLEPLKIIHYALAIKHELGFDDIKAAKKIVDDLWEYATHAQIDLEEE